MGLERPSSLGVGRNELDYCSIFGLVCRMPGHLEDLQASTGWLDTSLNNNTLYFLDGPSMTPHSSFWNSHSAETNLTSVVSRIFFNIAFDPAVATSQEPRRNRSLVTSPYQSHKGLQTNPPYQRKKYRQPDLRIFSARITDYKKVAERNGPGSHRNNNSGRENQDLRERDGSHGERAAEGWE